MTVQTRARTADQKKQRQQVLLDSAWQLFATEAYDALTVARVASEAGMAKGTVFLYFSTKEALFLVVLQQQLGAWLDMFDTALRASASNAPAVAEADLATFFADSLSRRPALLRLLAMVHNQLEPNAGLDAVIAFKRFLVERVSTSGALLEQHMCWPAGIGARAVLNLYALTVGIQHLTPTAIGRAAIQADQTLALFDIDFRRALQAAAQTLLAGMRAA
jgi:AcrR family transcriptional regulator